MPISGIRLPAMGGKYYLIFGGPYYEKPIIWKGVRMAVEIDLPADAVVPTQDFSTPSAQHLFEGLDKTVTWMMNGHPVYVGCMGGKGRTGIFLAALSKLWGYKNPIRFIRRHYHPHAVETREQAHYINNLSFPNYLKVKAKVAKWKGLLPFGGPSLTKI